jgi:hypothetical protein
MKRFTIIWMMIFGALSSFAQIPVPNFGFENWINANQPSDWLVRKTTSSQSNDKYAGNYALKLQTTIVPGNGDGDGTINSLPPNGTDGWQPAFPVSARHSTLNGYYKFSPLNGDSCQFIVILYKHGYNHPTTGNIVGYGHLCKSANSSYTPFTVSIYYLDGSTIPDSAFIIICAYKGWDFVTNTEGSPLGNSTLYIDNLSFDGFINGINTIPNTVIELNIFPNPASDIVFLSVDNKNNADLALNIYNEIGELVKSELLKQNQKKINTNDLSDGIYIIEIKSKEGAGKQKLIIQR